MVLAGGAGSRLGPLTDGRAKPAVPFAGTLRLVDFPLYNSLHSGISDVWVVHQHHPESLSDHLSNGPVGPGPHALPRLVAGGTAVQHRLESYWRDVGTLDAYRSAHRDLLGDPPRLDLDDPGWPIRTHGGQRPPARLRPGAAVEDSLVSPACVVCGTVRGSVLGPGVVVEPGASVVDSVVLADTVVRSVAPARVSP